MADRKRAISVRLDGAALDALNTVAGRDLSRSEAIRMALIEAAEFRRRRSTLAAEAEALTADAEDRAEMAEVTDLMEELRAPR